MTVMLALIASTLIAVLVIELRHYLMRRAMHRNVEALFALSAESAKREQAKI